MVVTIDAALEAALKEQANRQGVAPEVLVLTVLRERFLNAAMRMPPRDDWERRLRSAATDCGVSLPNEAVSSEGLYD